MNDEHPSIHDMSRKVGFFLVPGFQLLDLAGPLAAFQMTGNLAAKTLYEPLVLSGLGGLVAATMPLTISSQAAEVHGAGLDTLIVVGGAGVHHASDADVAILRMLAERARRVANVCTGAFLLARGGLLNGRRATTHWRHAARLQRMYPAVRVEMDRIFIADGPIWTSAGITAGIDLALALIEADHGTELSRAVARELVVEHRRAGGQSQHSEMIALDPESDRIKRVLVFARSHLDEPLDGERLAAEASLSLRHFNRLFREQTGETPAKAIERLRVEAARPRVEAGVEPVEAIAAAVGFADPERMRRAFIRRFGRPPQSIRRAARDMPSAHECAGDRAR